MSRDDESESNKRSAGKRFDAEPYVMSSEQGAEFEPSERRATMFAPDENDTLEEPPEAITAGERLPHVSEYSGIRLEALPVKGIKRLFYSVATLFAVLLAWDLADVYRGLSEMQPVLGYGFLVFVASVVGFGGVTFWRYRYDRDNLRALESIQRHAQRLRGVNDKGEAKKLIAELVSFSTDKPQALYLANCLKQLPDYSNDREVIAHLERSFLNPLDQEAIRRISKHSVTTGVSIAVSPWASLDMLLSLWRNVKMVEDVAQVYGVRPSLVSRLRLLKMVLHHMAMAGVSEVLIDQAGQVAAVGVSTVIGARATQGIAASIYTARIGIATMSVSRPFLFIEEDRPKVSALMKPIVHQVINAGKTQD
ncbi:MAG: TIGR01620 family protein [Cellvibrionaceae bacterium]